MFGVVIAVVFVFLKHVDSHAMLLDPPARNVLYRMGFPSAPYHENDDYLVCVETDATAGSCPPCGDPTQAQYPRPHEAGGQYATGVITRSYLPGQEIDINVNITQSHGGYIELKLCPNNDIYHPVEQSCLDLYPLQVAGKGTTRVKVNAPYGDREMINTRVKLPKDLTCSQCVMQMSFNTDQYLPSRVMFRNCADIEIVNNELPEVAPSTTAAEFTKPPIPTLRNKVTHGFQRDSVESAPPGFSNFNERRSHVEAPSSSFPEVIEQRGHVETHPSEYQIVNEQRNVTKAPPTGLQEAKEQRSHVEAQPSGFPAAKEHKGHVAPFRSRFQNERFPHRFSF